MMPFRPNGPLAAVLALIVAQAAAAGAINKWARQAEFIRTMKAVTAGEDIKIDRRNLRKERKEKMYRNLLAKAVPRPSVAGSGTSKTVDASLPEFMIAHGPTASRRKKTQEARDLEQDEEEEEPDWGAFGFDPSEFSIKYTACSAISFYSDEMAEAEDNNDVTMATKFVVFRLCPTDYCSNYASNGCGANYGEYLVPLAIYVEEYSRYKEELAEAYCEYCEQCMYFEKYFYGNRDLEGDDAVEDDAAGDDAVEGDDAAAEESHACKYYSECESYTDVCGGGEEEEGDDDYAAEEEEEEEYDQYFECAQFDGGNNNNNNGNNYYNAYYNQGLYIGPHCAEDGYTIEFGVFSDEYCSNYVGNDYSIEDVTGTNFGADFLADFYSSDCISCKESELPYMVPRGDEEDEDEITELCEGLYEQSAKCNVNLFDADSESYVAQNQEANEELVCSFIQNVLNGAYDVNGYVNQDGQNSISNLFSFDGSMPSIGQIFGLLALTIACVGLLVTIGFMHRSISKYNELKKRSALVPPEQEINRAESGVMVGRSFSRDYPDGTYIMT